MPQTRSAKKKLRRDVRKAVVNVRQKRSLKTLLKKAQETYTAEAVRSAVSAIDKAVKNHIFHRNKAARLKSQLTKSMKASPVKAASAKKSPKPAKTKATAKSKAKSTKRAR